MARLINSVSFEEINSIFFALCICASAQKIYPEVQQYFKILENLINYDEQQTHAEIDYLSELDEKLPNELGDSLTYKSKSPFGRHFENILKTCQTLVNQFEIKHAGCSKFEVITSSSQNYLHFNTFSTARI